MKAGNKIGGSLSEGTELPGDLLVRYVPGKQGSIWQHNVGKARTPSVTSLSPKSLPEDIKVASRRPVYYHMNLKIYALGVTSYLGPNCS